MPRKLQRRRDAGDLAPTRPPTVVPMDPRAALILGGAHIAHGTIQAGAQVTSAAVTAAGQVLEASVQSFGQCFEAFMGFMREREITARVIAQEREITTRVVAQEEAATARVQTWSAAVLAEAEARTEEVRIQATLVLASIEDRKNHRESRMVVIHGFMRAYQRWNAMLTDALASRADPMPLDKRELLQKHIETLLQRAREIEHAITSVAATL
ncbi:MAG TPA: hypothetical protein VIM11_20140 [Tepidisphaeraceae bacterium]